MKGKNSIKIGVIFAVISFLLFGCNMTLTEDEQIIKILENNNDFIQWRERNSNFSIQSTELSIEKADLKLKTTNMKAVYTNLPKKKLLEVLIKGNKSALITIVDMEKKEVIRIFGIMINDFGGLE